MTLLDRLKELKGPSREVDAEIARLICWSPTGVIPAGGAPSYWYSDGFGLPTYTASIDAAVALVEKMLPGAFREMTGPRRYLNIPTPVPAKFRSEILHDAGSAVAWHDHEPIALLIALLTALDDN